MPKTHRTIRYRLYPATQAKHQKSHGTVGACRYVWNYFVGKLKDDYAYYGECDFSFFSLGKDFTTIRKHYDKWLQECSAYIIKLFLQPIEICYKEFFRGNRGLPKFHGKYSTTSSFPINYQSARLAGSHLYIPKIGGMKLAGANPYPDGEFKSGTVKYECGKWYAYISYEVEQIGQPHLVSEVGIDRNVGQIALSDGTIHHLPDLKRKEARRRRYQSMMARLNREMLASVWHKLEQCLNYKMDVGKVPAHYTSQTCSQCGAVDKNNRKSQAGFKCVSCGRSDNADVNTALNILAVGNAAAGRGDGEGAWSVKRQK